MDLHNGQKIIRRGLESSGMPCWFSYTRYQIIPANYRAKKPILIAIFRACIGLHLTWQPRFSPPNKKRAVISSAVALEITAKKFFLPLPFSGFVREEDGENAALPGPGAFGGQAAAVQLDHRPGNG